MEIRGFHNYIISEDILGMRYLIAADVAARHNRNK